MPSPVLPFNGRTVSISSGETILFITVSDIAKDSSIWSAYKKHLEGSMYILNSSSNHGASLV